MNRATPGERNPFPLKEWHRAHTGGRRCPREDIAILPADLPQRQSRIVRVKYLRAQSSKWQEWQWIRHLLAFQGFGAILQSKLLSSHWCRVVTMKPWGTTNISVDNVTQLLSHGIRKTLQYAGYLLLLLLLYINNNNSNNHLPGAGLHLLFCLPQNQGSNSFDWVCVSAGYTSVPEQISLGCLYSQQGARQYGQWSLIKVYFSSKSPSFSHKNFILHNTDCIDEISVPVRASGHHWTMSQTFTPTI